MSGVLRTGMIVSSGGGIDPASEADKRDWTRLFHEQSDSHTSHVVTAESFGILVQAYGLRGSDRVCVEMVAGCGEGTYFEPIRICGCDSLCMSECRNHLFIPWPGRFRFIYTGTRLGLFNVFANPVSKEWFPVLAGVAGGIGCHQSGGDWVLV